MTLEALELARQLGIRGMYNFLLGTSATGLHEEGHDWESHAALMREALESATIRSDRLRLRALLGLLESPRGLHLDEIVAEVAGLVGDSTDPDDLFTVQMVRATSSLMSDDPKAAFAYAMEATGIKTQDADVGYSVALRAAIWARDLERVRTAATGIVEGPFTGAFGQAMRSRGTLPSPRSKAAPLRRSPASARPALGCWRWNSSSRPQPSSWTPPCYSLTIRRSDHGSPRHARSSRTSAPGRSLIGLTRLWRRHRRPWSPPPKPAGRRHRPPRASAP